MLDLLISGAMVVDGTGAPARRQDVGVADGKIVLSPADTQAREVIDASGLFLAPGFIDIHSHGDIVLGEDFARLCKVSQGVTTEVGGQCGSSMFPINPDRLEDAQTVLSVCRAEFPPEMGQWTSFEKYKEYVKTLALSANIKLLVGHSILRLAVMGMENRRPTAQELQEMKKLLRECMEQGALGMSSGLIYPPSAYADTEELVELCREVAPYDGIYATHMRNESTDVVRSVEEAIEIGRRAGVPVLISHHKACGRKSWGLPAQTLKLIAEANASGMCVTADQYPYTASMTHLKMCIPPKYFTMGAEGLADYLRDEAHRAAIKAEILDPETPFENQYLNCGGFENIFISTLPETPEYAGMFVSQAAEKMGKDPFEAYFDIMVMNKTIGGGIYYSMCESDLCNIITAPDTVVGSDGICRSMNEITHPRAWGTFPHAICYYHKQKGVLTLEEIIRKMTSLPAQRAMLDGKGVIADGYDADLVLFDYDALEDKATFTDSNALTEGIVTVFVAGQPVYHDKKLTGNTPGKLILHHKQGGKA